MPVPTNPRNSNQKGEEQPSVEEEDNPGQEQGFQLFAKYPARDHESNQAEYEPTGSNVNGVPAGEDPDRTAADQGNNDYGQNGQLFKETEQQKMQAG